ncbi:MULTISPECIES: DUF5802 family protein [Halorussus]|uniref:DUF5802 family protein n=1 Tax=Halorussus TaxID=1070314 RepID=UPI00209F0D62|nr:DUF5802 family protein [Halorussus vallis]USZ77271.1 DUF5802 family protein [Halorussus vallis]
MFEEFSSGYYLGRLYVEPSGEEQAVMRRDQHEYINEQLYATGEGVERLDAPLVMKVGRRHVAVQGADGVPEGTLALPESVIEDSDIRNPPALKEVLLAKADRAAQLLRYQDGHPGVGT